MIVDDEVPTQPLNVAQSSSGFLPVVALHRRGSQWHHESSFSHFWFFGVMCALALVMCFIPWRARMLFVGIPIRYLVAAGFLWGGICGLAPYYIRNRIGQRVVIDTDARMITIHQRDSSQVMSAVRSNPASILTTAPPALPTCTIRFADVLGVQMTGTGPFQANLVYRDGDAIVRHNLINHGGRAFARSIANAYCDAAGCDLLDHS